MKKLQIPLLLLGSFFAIPVMAMDGNDKGSSSYSTTNEQNPIKGQVKDEYGLGLADVEIRIKGTDLVTYTDNKGFFTFHTTPSLPKTVLSINYPGFTSKAVNYTNQAFVDITLNTEYNQLNEVVVTALGIKREQKKLGFAQQKIDADELASAEANNWSSGLKGKVSGLNIISSGSGPINSQQIILRGTNSFDSDKNSALIVIDGVIMSTEMSSSGNDSAYMGNDSPVDFGNALSELNQNDIESVVVLKGPAAAALYGNKAGNGALIITTKSGKKTNKIGIEYKTSIALDVVNHWPDYQYEYGQGTGKNFDKNGQPYYSYGSSEDGPSTSSSSSAFGPKFNGQQFFQYDPLTQGQGSERTPWVPYKDTHKGYWKTGYTLSNSLTFSGGDKDGSFRASIGHQKNQWIMPNTGYENYTASVNGNYKLSKNLKVSTVVNYTNKSSDNIPGTGYNNGSIAYFMIMHNPSADLNWYKPRWKKDAEGTDMIRPFSSYIDNPYVIAHEAVNPFQSSQLVGNLRLDFTLSPKVNLMLRSALNTYTQLREQNRPYDLNRTPRGYYKRQDISKNETNIDFLFTYNEKIGRDFTFNGNLGGNRLNYDYRSVSAYVDGLVVPGVYKLSNGLHAPLVATGDKAYKENSVYGMASFGWKDRIFVDVTSRNDWSSTLPKANSSFFYPSVSSSFILSDLFKIKGPVNFLKYRLSFAKVGNGTTPYRTSKYYNNSEFPSSSEVAGELYNPDLKPETTKAWETGLEMLLFKKRVGLDITLYKQNTDNQIVSIPLDLTTGYSSRVINAGEIENKGIEIAANFTPIKRSGFEWRISGTWSTNSSKVLSLPKDMGVDEVVMGSAGTVSMLAREGSSATGLYGYKFVRNEQGQIIYDSNGLPVRPNAIELVGDATPDWRAGLTNSFKIKDFRFSFTFDAQYGGIVYSQSYHKLMEQGKLADSLPGREDGFIIGDGVVKNTDGSYSANTKKVDVATYYAEYNRRANVESNSFDASYLKLREVSLNYTLPKKLIRSTGLDNLSVTVYARDLFTISDFPMYDPETAALNGKYFVPNVEMGQMPSTASYGITIKAAL